MKKCRLPLWIKNIKNIPYNIYLCLRFNFLYPRNRWSNKHWESWKLEEYLHGKRPEYKYEKGEDGKYHSVIIKPATDGLYGKAYATVDEWIDDTQYIGDKIQSYPWFIWYKIVSFIANYFLPLFHCIPTYTELDAMPIGWRKAFGIQMCKDLKKQFKKDKCYKDFRITQLKEKWGSLRLYSNFGTDEVFKIINKYEDLSYNTCINCGKPATVISSGWISPYCDSCYEEQYHEGNIPYERKINGKWEETEEHKEAWKRIDKEYAKDKEKV